VVENSSGSLLAKKLGYLFLGTDIVIRGGISSAASVL